MAQLRTLYDEEFIASGCDPSLYDPQDAFDNTVGTYATNFAIGAIGFLFALLFLFAKKPFPWVCYFFLTGLSYLLAGVGHYVGDESFNDKLVPAFIPILLVANHLLLDRGLCSLTESRKARIVLLLVDIAVVAANVVYNAILGGLLLLGISLLVSFIVMLFLFVYHIMVLKGNRLVSVGKALAVLIMGGSLVIQVVLAGDCGSDEYEFCFENCPLPDPVHFNHNALFHAVFAVGFFLQGMLEFRQPTGLFTVRKVDDGAKRSISR